MWRRPPLWRYARKVIAMMSEVLIAGRRSIVLLMALVALVATPGLLTAQQWSAGQTIPTDESGIRLSTSRNPGQFDVGTGGMRLNVRISSPKENRDYPLGLGESDSSFAFSGGEGRVDITDTPEAIVLDLQWPNRLPRS